MVTGRVEFRLDQERRRKLACIAEERRAAISEVLRQLIDQAYHEIDRARRRRAAEAIAAMEIMDMPEPDELKRWINATYDTPDPD